MVNQQVLKEQIIKTPPNLQNGGDLFIHIFTAEPNLRKHWDVEDIDPDQIGKSRQMQQKGAQLLSSWTHLVSNLESDKPFKLEIGEVRDSYKEAGLKSADIKKLTPGVIAFFEAKIGKLNETQKGAWKEFFDKVSIALKEAGLDN